MDARSAAARDDAFLLDVREPGEWAAGHVEGATHIPMATLGARQDELPTDRLIVCVCRSGSRSAAVTRALLDAGYRAENLDGGLLGWAASDLPLVDVEGEPGRVV